MSGMEPLDFLQSISGYLQANQPGDVTTKIKLGTIDASYVASTYPGTLPKVTFDGETTLSSKRYAVMSSYWPQPSDRVVLLPIGATYLILGALDQDGNGYFGGTVKTAPSNSGQNAFETRVPSDTDVRWQVNRTGTVAWGSGSATPDTNLYRSAANTLKTDDSLDVAGGLVVAGRNQFTQGKLMTQMLSDVASSALSLTSTATDVPGLSIAFNTSYANAIVDILWVSDFESTAASTAVCITFLNIDGSDVGIPQAIFEQDAANDRRATLVQTYQTTLASAGAHTIKLRGQKAGGTDNACRVNTDHTRMRIAVYE